MIDDIATERYNVATIQQERRQKNGMGNSRSPQRQSHKVQSNKGRKKSI